MKLAPRTVVFDVDGVLVDVRRSYHRSILQTVRHFTGRRVTFAEVHRWKNRPGYNDDWKLTTDWLASLGHPHPYAEVKRKFEEFFGAPMGTVMVTSRASAGWCPHRGSHDG